MSTRRQHGSRTAVSNSVLYARLHAYGLRRAGLLRAVATRQALHAVARGVAALLGHAGTTALTWQNRYNARQHMAMLDARLLDDVGLTRADIERVADRPFWRA
jgi:uncharacterized protein YjiS (DUF1127 family)